ncbi:MAG: hypothetical protein RH948_02875 [Cyclobacteriaceae bacterium]
MNKIKITAARFIEILDGKHDQYISPKDYDTSNYLPNNYPSIIIKDHIVEGRVNFVKEVFQEHELLLESVEFTNSVNISIGKGISWALENCRFHDSLTFDNCSIIGLTFVAAEIKRLAKFSNCQQMHLHLEKMEAGSIVIENCNNISGLLLTASRLGKVEIKNSKIGKANFYAEGGGEVFDLEVSAQSNIGILSFDNHFAKGDIILRDSAIKSISFRGCYFKNLEVSNCRIEEGNFKIARISDSIRINGGNYGEISFDGLEVENEIKFSGSQFGVLKLVGGKNCKIGIINIDGIISETMLMKNIMAEEIIFGLTIQNNASIYVMDLKVNKLSFENLLNAGQFFLQRVSELISNAGLISFLDSKIGNMELISFPLETWRIRPKSSEVGGIRIIGGSIPVIKENKLKYSIDMNLDPSDYYDFYDQLHQSLKINKTLDRKYYVEKLQWSRVSYQKELSKSNSGDWQNRLYYNSSIISLKAHDFSSDFGYNWIKSLGLYIVFSLLCYLIYSISIVDVGIEHLGVDNLFYHFAESLKFATPRTNFVLIENPPWYSILVDIIYKIGSGFLIYQTISAFRKAGRNEK